MFFKVKTATICILLSGSALVATNSLADSKMTTGLEGVIRIGPAQPGPARLGVPNTQPLINTAFVVKQGDKIVASFHTDHEGRFHVSLAPGKYLVSRKDWKGRVGNYGPFEVEIVAGEVKKVQWECDSGME